MLHGLRRFSEDLDFILKSPNADFAWSSYFDGLVAVLAEFGVRCELNFALKIHALLCRPYLKGRDWFDFGWYVAQGVTPNLPHLAAALDQYGPWRGQGVTLDRVWLESALIERIRMIDWPTAARDVAPFLAAPEQAGLKLWSERFFAGKVAKLALR